MGKLSINNDTKADKFRFDNVYSKVHLLENGCYIFLCNYQQAGIKASMDSQIKINKANLVLNHFDMHSYENY